MQITEGVVGEGEIFMHWMHRGQHLVRIKCAYCIRYALKWCSGVCVICKDPHVMLFTPHTLLSGEHDAIS